MAQKRKIYEGKAKILYEGPEPGTLVQYFKDDTTAFDASKKAILNGKGVLNNRISEFLMTRLNTAGIPTHFIRRLNMREQLVRELEMIPLETVCRNVAAGSICKRLGLKEGEPLPRSLIEFYYKMDSLGDPLVSEEHINAFNWASHQEMDDMISLTFRANDFMCGLFSTVGIRLVDFKLEFGRHYQGDMVRVMVADEISPDSCRLWDMNTGRKFDKDRFRQDLGEVTESYAEVAKRLGVIRTDPQDTSDGKDPTAPEEPPTPGSASLRSKIFSRGKKS